MHVNASKCMLRLDSTGAFFGEMRTISREMNYVHAQ